MKCRIQFFWLGLLLFVIGCKNKTEKKEVEALSSLFPEKTVCFPFSFHTEKDYPKKEFRLEEIADISFIPLESPRGKMLGNLTASRKFFTKEGIFLGDDSKIFRFDPDGHFLNTIGRKGHGPTEYTYIHHYCLDEQQRQVYIYAGFQHRILVYDYEGNYIRKFQVRGLSSPVVFDSTSLVVWKNIRIGKNDFLSISPFERISAIDGHTLDSFVAAPRENPIAANTNPIFGTFRKIIRFRDDCILTHDSQDTIYTLTKDKRVLSRYIKQPLNKTLGTSRWFYDLILETDGFAIVNLFRMKDPRNADIRYLMIDKKSGEICCPDFTMKNYFITDEKERVSLVLYDVGNPNTTFVPINAYVWIELLKRNKLEGRLKEIASGLTENSNPVLMMIKFKDSEGK